MAPSKQFGFDVFMEPGQPINPTGVFRENVRCFLSEGGELQDYKVEGMSIWRTLLVHKTSNLVFPLYTIEEQVEHSPRPYCDHCRCTGWRYHFVSNRKYHWIIPNGCDWNKPLEVGVFDLQTHLLHGLIHCNGFGHLLRINNRIEGGCILHGKEIMDLWDRICTNLRTREVTIKDLSKKMSMDLRLLHAVLYGHTWFGKWGYRFFAGSYGVIEVYYNEAIEILSSLELDKIILDFNGTVRGREMKQIVHYYQNMAETIAETKLKTLRDLFKFMLLTVAPAQKRTVVATSATSLTSPELLRNLSAVKDKSLSYKRFSIVAKMDSSGWSARSLEGAAEVILKVLQGRKAYNLRRQVMSREAVRNAARKLIKETGLLDYVLTLLDNVIVGNHIVDYAVNPDSQLFEYTVHEFSDGALEPRSDLYRDVVYLYKNVLLSYPGSESVELPPDSVLLEGDSLSESVALATRIVLDSKHFVKVWPFRVEVGQLRLECHAIPLPIFYELDFKKTPGEWLMVPPDSTYLELKKAAESALRDTYCVMKNFVVKKFSSKYLGDDQDMLPPHCSFAQMWIFGEEIGPVFKLRYEGWNNNKRRIVKCECGVNFDDGERISECHNCKVWQHTRCNDIDDSEIVPLFFICLGCCHELVIKRAEILSEGRSSGNPFKKKKLARK